MNCKCLLIDWTVYFDLLAWWLLLSALLCGCLALCPLCPLCPLLLFEKLPVGAEEVGLVLVEELLDEVEEALGIAKELLDAAEELLGPWRPPPYSWSACPGHP